MVSIMIDFLRFRGFSFAFLGALLFAVIGTSIYKLKTRGSAFNYSVEFTGGTETFLGFEKPVSVEKINQLLDQAGWQGAIIREFSPTEILIRVKEYSNDPLGLAGKMKNLFQEKLSDNQVQIKSVDSVGPGIGKDLRNSSILAILVSLLLMLIYIAIRFRSPAFALGAFVALFHDVLVILAAYLLFNLEISIAVVAAILLILGYSINDTIIIFSRIRENIGQLRSMSIYDIVNLSLNQTLTRSIYTSFSTALVVIPLVIFGGPTIQTLAIPFLIGIVFGTYSSIFVASPAMLLFYKEKR